ncbi:neurotrophin 1-like [Tachypleus tridentatus]|uniref:neurotrophin 1-like n=1 Tax=Tachypleus tridentatus TaxID=6853 RepID=UPI003FD2FE69
MVAEPEPQSEFVFLVRLGSMGRNTILKSFVVLWVVAVKLAQSKEISTVDKNSVYNRSIASLWEENWFIPEAITNLSLSVSKYNNLAEGKTIHQVEDQSTSDSIFGPVIEGDIRKILKESSYNNRRADHSSNFYGEDDHGPAGSTKAPKCAQYGSYYCNYKDEYPIDIVTTVTKYLKWPLEKLFRDLKYVRMPKLADAELGKLVCESLTRIVRPGWAKNTNGYWLVVINTDYYQQYITEVVCRYENSYCNFVPPCYYASCQQRYNTQYLLVIDPYNPYKGPFLSQFIFPSCCVCYVPNSKS